MLSILWVCFHTLSDSYWLNTDCAFVHIGKRRKEMRAQYLSSSVTADTCQAPSRVSQTIGFHFSENMFSFSKWVSEWAFISKVWFFFEMCFHFQNVKGFVSVVFPFSEKHNCKQKSVHSLQIALLMRMWTNNELYMKLLNLLQFFKNLLFIMSELASLNT